MLWISRLPLIFRNYLGTTLHHFQMIETYDFLIEEFVSKRWKNLLIS